MGPDNVRILIATMASLCDEGKNLYFDVGLGTYVTYEIYFKAGRIGNWDNYAFISVNLSCNVTPDHFSGCSHLLLSRPDIRPASSTVRVSSGWLLHDHFTLKPLSGQLRRSLW